MNMPAGTKPDGARFSFISTKPRFWHLFCEVPPPLFPLRVAWRQLWAERTRLLAAVAGVMFATVLMLMLFGFRAALFDTAVALPQAIRGQLFLIDPQTQALFRFQPLPRIRAYQALASPDVVQSVPIYLAQEPWRNPLTGARRFIQLIGFNMRAGAVEMPGLASVAGALMQNDAVAFDALSRPEFGPIAQLFREHGALKVELADREVNVVGLVKLGPSFAADGSVVMNPTTFRRLVPENAASDVALVALRLRQGVDVAQIRKRLTTLLPPDVQVITHRELMRREKSYWNKETPIGVIFAFCSLLGLMVGIVIVYQILFTDVSSHVRAYATLKALGFSHGYLQLVVLGEACILACLGYVPGFLSSVMLYKYVGQAAHLPLDFTIARSAAVFAIIISMCVVAGLMTLRKLREADPASLF